jgi:hypothetical protein
MRLASVAVCLLFALASSAFGTTITLGGVITQSVSDGTGPATGNPSLNNIMDAQAFSLKLNSATLINGPGFYDLTGSSLVFSVPVASASETNFAAISLSVTANGSDSDFSLLACISGADCFTGNALTANFRVPTSMIGGSGVSAIGLDQPHPLDLLEDDGITDLHGSIDTYSGTVTTVVTPEPASGSLLAIGLSAMAMITNRARHRFSNHA